jgi:hypothetical protein
MGRGLASRVRAPPRQGAQVSGQNGVQLAEMAPTAPASNGVTYVLAPAEEAGEALSLSALVEALLFVADAPVAVTDLARALGDRKSVV